MDTCPFEFVFRGCMLTTVKDTLKVHGLNTAPVGANSVTDKGLCAATSGHNGVGKIIMSCSSVYTEELDIGLAEHGYGRKTGHPV